MMRRKYAFAFAAGLLLSGAGMAPQPAYANIFDSMKKGVSSAAHHVVNAAKKAGNAIRHTADRVGHDIQNDAGKANGWARNQAEHVWRNAEDAAKHVKKATEEGWNALKRFAKNPTGNCESFARTVAGKVDGALGYATRSSFGQLALRSVDPKVRKVAGFMAGSECSRDMRAGFSCGIFPYASGIARAVRQGMKGGNSFAHRVGRAMKGACRSVPLPARPDCAIVVAVAEEAEQGGQCLKDIVARYAARSGGMHLSKRKICTMTGEVMFGMGLDTSIANSAGAYAKAVQYAQKLRTVLAVSAMLPLPASCGGSSLHANPTLTDTEAGVLSNFARVKGKAIDVADAWVVGNNGKVYRYAGKTWKVAGKLSNARRIGGSRHAPWVVDAHGRIYHWESGKWNKVTGMAVDVGDGWVVAKGGYIYRWNRKSRKWDRMPGSAVRIGGTYARPWVVNRHHWIYRWNESKGEWDKLPGAAVDVADGWAISARKVGKSDREVVVWSGNGWQRIAGARAVAVGGTPDSPWVVNASHDIFNWVDQ